MGSPKLSLTTVFEKNHAAYTAMQDGERKYRNIINSGGSSAGKTFSILQLLVAICNKSKKQIDIVGLTVPHLKGGVINDIPRVFEGYGLDFSKMYNVSDKRIDFENGSVINFIAIDKVGKAHGGRRDILFINEANYIHYNIVEQLIIRTRETVFIDFNPTNEFWVHSKMLANEADKTLMIKSTYKDNHLLEGSIVKALESKRGDGTNNFWRVYGLGELGITEGLIFKNWEEKEFDIYQFEQYRNGLDWGFSRDPFAFVRVALEKNCLYICEEIYQTDLLNKTSAPMVKVITRGEPVYCDSAEPKSIAEYNELGVNAYSVKKGAGSIESGIKKLQAFDKIYVHTSCKNALIELKNYQWRRDKNNDEMRTPESGFDHLIDAIRYAVSQDSVHVPDVIEAKLNGARRRSGGGWMGA
jgi:phage terminase large subunit